MQNAIDIKHLTREKLIVMEALWEDLTNDLEPVESPEWHKLALQETEKRYDSGQEKIFDWKDAKKILRNRFE